MKVLSQIISRDQYETIVQLKSNRISKQKIAKQMNICTQRVRDVYMVLNSILFTKFSDKKRKQLIYYVLDNMSVDTIYEKFQVIINKSLYTAIKRVFIGFFYENDTTQVIQLYRDQTPRIWTFPYTVEIGYLQDKLKQVINDKSLISADITKFEDKNSTKFYDLCDQPDISTQSNSVQIDEKREQLNNKIINIWIRLTTIHQSIRLVQKRIASRSELSQQDIYLLKLLKRFY